MSSVVLVPGVATDQTLIDCEHYEVINGACVELPPMGAFQSVLASYLGQIIGHFAKTHNLGWAVVETLFQLDSQGKLQRRPDVAFVSYQRWPKNRTVPDTNAWDVIPVLAIEVNSPSNTANEILQKVQDYFRFGVECVWVVYPTADQIYVYSSPTQNVILTKGAQLDGANILPGFQLPVADVFAMGAPEVPSTNGSASPS